MNSEKFIELQAAIYEVGLLFNQSPNEAKINAYAKALMNYSSKQVVFAFNQVILSGTAFFPSLAEVLAHLRPAQENSKEVGNLVANEIIQSCINHGRYQVDKITASLSPMASKVIENNRYLVLEILDSERDQLPSIRAQIRDLVSASNEGIKNASKNESLNKIGINTDNVLSLKKPEFRTIDFSGFLPGDLA